MMQDVRMFGDQQHAGIGFVETFVYRSIVNDPPAIIVLYIGIDIKECAAPALAHVLDLLIQVCIDVLYVNLPDIVRIRMPRRKLRTNTYARGESGVFELGKECIDNR